MALHIPGAEKAQMPTTRIWNRVLRKNGMLPGSDVMVSSFAAVMDAGAAMPSSSLAAVDFSDIMMDASYLLISMVNNIYIPKELITDRPQWRHI